MLVLDIPTRLDIRCPPFTGIYDRRQMADRTLYCWFNNESDTNFPHVSIHSTAQSPNWTEFHVTFPVLHQGGWDDAPSKRSFSLYFRFNDGKLELYEHNYGDIRRSKNDPNPMGYDEMKSLGKVFALRFVQKAIFQGALQ